MTQDAPQDPISELSTGAIQYHEVFDSLVQAGFTRPEALQILISILAITMGQQGG